jgi:hypothetical protein
VTFINLFENKIDDGPGNEITNENLGVCDGLTRRNVIMRDHQAAISKDGQAFYVTVPEEAGGSMGWSEKDDDSVIAVWEAAKGDGKTLLLVRKELEGLVKSSKTEEETKKQIKVLIDNETRSDGSTLMHVAASLDSPEALALCRFLVETVGAKLSDVTDHSGRTALEIAIANSNPHMSGWAKSVGTFLGRYLIIGGDHVSATCTVQFATDIRKKKMDVNCRVAIKKMTDQSRVSSTENSRLGSMLIQSKLTQIQTYHRIRTSLSMGMLYLFCGTMIYMTRARVLGAL